jgi:hypothetical protein
MSIPWALQETMMKYIATLFILGSLMAGCVSSSSPPPPAAHTTVVVPPSNAVAAPSNVVVEPGTGTGTTVVCQNGGAPPCY